MGLLYCLLFASLTVCTIAVSINTKPENVQITFSKPVPKVFTVDKPLKISSYLMQYFYDRSKSGLLKELYTAQVNEYVDILLSEIEPFLIEYGLDPLSLPDIYESFEVKLILLKIQGELNMTNGWLYDVKTLHRGGDCFLKYEYELLYLEVPLTFNNLFFRYDYHADILNIGPTGNVEGSVRDLRIFAKVMFDFHSMQATLLEFRVDHAGFIDVNFTGNVLIDWLLELLVNLVTNLLHGLIVGLVETNIYDILELMVASINGMLDAIFLIP